MATPKDGASAAQRAALDRGRKAGNAARRKQIAAAKRRKARNPNAKSRHQMLVEGELTVEQLDDDELQKFRGRDIDGEFKGRVAPLPPKIHAAIRNRLLSQMQTAVEGFLPRATAILSEIAETSEHEPSRVNALKLLMERGAGKVPEKVLIGSADPWGEALEEFLETADDESAAAARERLGRMSQAVGDE